MHAFAIPFIAAIATWILAAICCAWMLIPNPRPGHNRFSYVYLCAFLTGTIIAAVSYQDARRALAILTGTAALLITAAVFKLIDRIYDGEQKG